MCIQLERSYKCHLWVNSSVLKSNTNEFWKTFGKPAPKADHAFKERCSKQIPTSVSLK